MRIRVLGAGWYGCHIARTLLADDKHEIELHESGPRLFSGASGANPARLHLGFHYPRSRLTRHMCLDHQFEFMQTYGHLTRGVPVNIYAVAEHDSLVDFGTYRQVLKHDVEYVTIDHPHEFGLKNVEGAVLTGERHIVIDLARRYFELELLPIVKYQMPPGELDDDRWDWTIDCTFCSNGSEGVDRYEPCLVVLLEGPTNRAVTIMDGPFPSLYPWNEDRGLSSLTSAKWTPFSKTCKTYEAAREVLDNLCAQDIEQRSNAMLDSMAHFYPSVKEDYRIAGHKLAIRAMARSGADARLADLAPIGGRALRVRAGKIDAVLHAERLVREYIGA